MLSESMLHCFSNLSLVRFSLQIQNTNCILLIFLTFYLFFRFASFHSVLSTTRQEQIPILRFEKKNDGAQVVAAQFCPRTPRRRTRKRKRSGSAILCLIGFLCNFLDRKRNRNFSHARGLVLFESYRIVCLVLSFGGF